MKKRHLPPYALPTNQAELARYLDELNRQEKMAHDDMRPLWAVLFVVAGLALLLYGFGVALVHGTYAKPLATALCGALLLLVGALFLRDINA